MRYRHHDGYERRSEGRAGGRAMAPSNWHSRLMTRVLGYGRRRAARCLAGVAVLAASLLGAAMPAAAATPHTLKVVIHGSGSVSSKPAGIACPRKCTAKFAVGTSVRLTPKAKSGSRFLRWSGSCTGSGACKVKMSGQKAVTAQFVQSNEPVAVPGPYSGADVGSITFDVAPGGRSMLNVYVPTTYLTCTPSGAINDQFEILQVAIKSNGSFSARTSQNGVLSGSNAKFSYILAGHFEPATRSTPASAAGTWRENIVFASGTVASCTSNKQTWTATLYREPAKKEIVARPGPYSGADVGSITFDVAPGGRSMLNVYVPTTYLTCTPSGAINDQFEMLQVAIKSNGSFSAEGSQKWRALRQQREVHLHLCGILRGPHPSRSFDSGRNVARERRVRQRYDLSLHFEQPVLDSNALSGSGPEEDRGKARPLLGC